MFENECEEDNLKEYIKLVAKGLLYTAFVQKDLLIIKSEDAILIRECLFIKIIMKETIRIFLYRQ